MKRFVITLCAACAIAVASYAQAIRLNPNFAEAYYNRGITYAKKGEYDKALADFTKTLELDPNHANAKRFLEEARKKIQ